MTKEWLLATIGPVDLASPASFEYAGRAEKTFNAVICPARCWSQRAFLFSGRERKSRGEFQILNFISKIVQPFLY